MSTDSKKVIYEYFNSSVIVSHHTTVETTPFFCPVCGDVMTSPEDPDFYKEYQSCTACAIKWAEPNREKWNSGWRPDIDND